MISRDGKEEDIQEIRLVFSLIRTGEKKSRVKPSDMSVRHTHWDPFIEILKCSAVMFGFVPKYG